MRGRRVILAGVIVAAVLVPAMAEAKDDKPGVGASEHAVSGRPRINRLAKAKDCAGLQRELVVARDAKSQGDGAPQGNGSLVAFIDRKQRAAGCSA